MFKNNINTKGNINFIWMRKNIVQILFVISGLFVISLNFSIIKLISIFVLLYNAIMDYKTRMVDTRVTYIGIFILLLIKIPEHWNTATFWQYSILFIFSAVIFYIASRLLEKHIGSGDFDILFFVLISLGFMGFIKCIFYTF